MVLVVVLDVQVVVVVALVVRIVVQAVAGVLVVVATVEVLALVVVGAPVRVGRGALHLVVQHVQQLVIQLVNLNVMVRQHHLHKKCIKI